MEKKRIKKNTPIAVKKEVKLPAKEEKKDFWGKLGNFVKKSIDCCLE